MKGNEERGEKIERGMDCEMLEFEKNESSFACQWEFLINKSPLIYDETNVRNDL